VRRWLWGTLCILVACGGGGAAAPDPRYPARAEGCEVTTFHDEPSMPTDNIGPVRARCSQDVADADCLRTLKDQVCKLGGDVAWGVPEQPTKVGDKNEWSARSAHTRVGSPPKAP
jgi:hypothetical protein